MYLKTRCIVVIVLFVVRTHASSNRIIGVSPYGDLMDRRAIECANPTEDTAAAVSTALYGDVNIFYFGAY